ncbi:Trp biosynthesis-associated membrane protein [Microlunatus soli]|uniref:Trp region conserved hypothetical membrane protein n=1 Tax=Microlunatus soli TaxID=630515 RepID=A0A1H2A3E8_9ACTN|nr:Trp biosynthesis-associated membrane protein [Microlunatus soli]SDT40501.1 trp region conserved hypothetical membrane protein [Microlunatus soli]
MTGSPSSDATPARPNSDRSRAVGFGLLLVGAIAVLVGASVPWYAATEAGRRMATFNGTDVTGGVAQALGVAILAGVLLMLALRVTGRRIVAGLIGVIAIIGAVTMTFQRPGRSEVLTELRKQTLADSYQLTIAGGNICYAAGCLVVLAGVVVVIARAHRWPRRADRFDRRAAAARSALLTDDPDAEIDTDAVWKSIDAGQDPTVEPRS